VGDEVPVVVGVGEVVDVEVRVGVAVPVAVGVVVDVAVPVWVGVIGVGPSSTISIGRLEPPSVDTWCLPIEAPSGMIKLP
jgi:hypothetical protein